MFSDKMGFRSGGDATEVLHVRHGAAGHAAYGPYEQVRPGCYRVDYRLAIDTGTIAPPRWRDRIGARLDARRQRSDDDVCATIDVAAYLGQTILVRRDILRSELTSALQTFSLPLANREFRALEYRVQTYGNAPLVIGEPRLVWQSDVPTVSTEPDPTVETDDPVELQNQVRALLRPLRPQRAAGFEKIRLGHTGDGGYVMLDDFAGIDCALSLGINDDISWDLDAADRGLTIHQFDHTVDDPAPDDARMIFNKKMVAVVPSAGSVSLSDLIARHDRGAERPNMILKMDIEGSEWPVFAALSDREISRFSQILCEFHGFAEIGDIAFRRGVHAALSRITRHHALAHVHANACGGIANLANLTVPGTLEFTFVNRALYDLEDSDELFPGPLDTSCDAFSPDIFIGAFRF